MHKNATTPAAGAQRAPSFLDAEHAKPRPDGKPYKLDFGQGLQLRIGASGVKTWICKAQREGKQTTHTLGRFPAMKIKQAHQAREAIRNAIDPVREKRIAKAAIVAADEATFRVVAEDWITAANTKARWTPLHLTLVRQRLAKHVYPVFGDRPVASITPPEVRALVLAVHKKGPAVAVAIKQYVTRALELAWTDDLITSNPARKTAALLPSRLRAEEAPNAHAKTIEDARAVLAAVEARRRLASPWSILAHRLIALTGVRKNEALGATWDEFDLDAAVWTIPAARMKGRAGKRVAHVVALAPQAIEVVRAARHIRQNEFVFSSSQRFGHKAGKQIGRCSLNAIMRMALHKAGLGKVMVPHGWRHSFSTIMNEVDDGASFRVIDVMLAHKGFRDSADARDARKGGTESHYNHATYRSARHRIACQWADMLLEGAPTPLALIGLDEAPATNVVPLRRTAA